MDDDRPCLILKTFLVSKIGLKLKIGPFIYVDVLGFSRITNVNIYIHKCLFLNGYLHSVNIDTIPRFITG